MTKKSEVFSESSPDASLERCLDSVTHRSGVMVKASVIAPRDIINGLPEELLRWLHEDLDRGSFTRLASRRTSHNDFESIVVDRLFPLRDTRAFTRRLRVHCQATATAAGILAEVKGQSTRVASVCGWLHDIGIAACIKHADEVANIADDESLAKLWPIIIRFSTQHGIRLASRWRLPSAIRHAIRDHESFVTLATPNPIVATTFVAEHVAAIVGCEFHEQVPALAIERALSVLQLGERGVLAVAAHTERLMRLTP